MNTEIPDYLRTDHCLGLESIEEEISTRVERYRDALRHIPPSGGGGCHAALLGIANLGRSAEISREQIAADLAAHVHGTRKITTQEIQDAINKAFQPVGKFRPRKRPAIDGAKLLQSIIERGAAFTEAELLDASPIRIDWLFERDGIEVLQRLYSPEERLFIGEKYDADAEHVKTVSAWIRHFERGVIPAHIIPNPLTGKPGTTKTGSPSHRADDCVEKFRFAVIEFDAMPRFQQIQFWAGVKLPIAALIDSGGKSIHAWVRIDARDAAKWEERVEQRLFDVLRELGADGTCRNEARLSRTPGHLCDGMRRQRLLYLAPEGSPVLP